ncbi:hypothetical protein D4R51_00445 [bacterium]|nr:MAG: hypothetical protein D4R51_00445 [bacterium]
MFEWLIDVLKSTIEYQEFTANGFFSAGILTALGTVLFSCLQGYGIFEQGRTIWRKRSAERVSNLLVLSGASYFLTFIVYGISRVSIAAVFNGLLGFVFLYPASGLLKFRGFRMGEWAYFMVFLSAIPTMVFIGDKDTFLFVLLMGLLVTAFPQTAEAYRAWRKGDPGSIEPKFFISFLIAGLFWFGYGLWFGKWVFVVFNPISSVNLSLALIFWWLAKKKAEEKKEYRF